MTDLLRRLHIWVGLFNLTVLIVFAATGIAATFPAQTPPAPNVRFVDYEAPPTFTDKQVADDLFAKLDIPLVGQIPDWAVHRNAQNQLALDFYGPNGTQKVVVLEAEKRVRVELAKNSTGEFMDAMHSMTFSASPPDLRVRLWGLYIDLSIFSLLFMTVTGIWLWLASRPRLWWAQVSFAAGTGLFVVLWFVTR